MMRLGLDDAKFYLCNEVNPTDHLKYFGESAINPSSSWGAKHMLPDVFLYPIFVAWEIIVVAVAVMVCTGLVDLPHAKSQSPSSAPSFRFRLLGSIQSFFIAFSLLAPGDLGIRISNAIMISEEASRGVWDTDRVDNADRDDGFSKFVK
ncbi:hypothetical protein Tco_1218967 [Tanacetum coccineum]